MPGLASAGGNGRVRAPLPHNANDFANPQASANIFKVPYLSSRAGGPAARVYACATTKPIPDPALKPNTNSDTSYHPSGLVIETKLDAIRKPSAVAAIQEDPERTNVCLSEPEPSPWYNDDIPRKEPRYYTQWHTWSDSQKREWFSNIHEEGGNLMFSDGHAAYSKYRKLTSLDFGLVKRDNGQVMPWTASEADSRSDFKAAAD